MNTKIGMLTIEIPHLDMFDVPILMGKFEEFINGLKKDGYKSDFEHYHINAEMDHFEGVEFDEDGDGDGDGMPVPVIAKKKKKSAEHLKVVES